MHMIGYHNKFIQIHMREMIWDLAPKSMGSALEFRNKSIGLFLCHPIYHTLTRNIL